MTDRSVRRPRAAAAPRCRVIVAGAGMGGLAAALDLARAGCAVTVCERAAAPGGKIRRVQVGGRSIDAGPTVLTMRWVFDELLADTGADLGARVRMVQAQRLARHVWADGAVLDLERSREGSAAAIAAFAGPRAAAGFHRFMEAAERTHDTLRTGFLTAAKPGPVTLTRRVGVRRALALEPFTSYWRCLGRYFADPRLRQLYGRYATYCGASPYAAPATLMLVAFVEQSGVWLVDGGLRVLADALAARAVELGVTFRQETEVTGIVVRRGRVAGARITGDACLGADAVVWNGDASALASGLLGPGVRSGVHPVARGRRSLSALTWAMTAEPRGCALEHHNVFFSPDYRREFADLFGHARIPDAPTVYVNAQDRGGVGVPTGAARPCAGDTHPGRRERFLCLVNAPADGDSTIRTAEELERCRETMLRMLRERGLELRAPEWTATSPADFATLFPGSGGALYGRATHGWLATFLRPGSRAQLPGLYLAGGSVHPGPGVPMAALSGRLAARSLLADRISR